MDGSLWEVLRQRAGPARRLRFDDFQRTVLYEPGLGYYAKTAARAGRSGDFLTSPEVAPIFADCLANALLEDFELLESDTYDVLELGAGKGTLARDLFEAFRREGLGSRVRFHLVEISEAARAAHAQTLSGVPRERWRSYRALEDLAATRFPAGAVVANEFFDNLPVRRVMQAGQLLEIHVRVRPGSLREELAPAPVELSAYLEAQRVHLATGQTAEICLEAPHVLAQAVARLETGSAILVDYGDEARHLYDVQRFPSGTLSAYHGHHSAPDPYTDLGERDLTCHVNFSALRETLEAAGFGLLFFGTQSRFLLDHGLPERLEERRMASRDDFDRLRWTQWAKQLYHPEALGESFRVLHARTPPRVRGRN